MHELRHRGVAAILIAVVDGLKGLPEAITGVFPETTVPASIAPLTRFILAYGAWQDRPKVAHALKTIHRAARAEEGARCRDVFAESELGQKYPMLAASWRRPWAEVLPFSDDPPELRKMLDTTNAIASLNMQVRKGVKNRGALSERRGGGPVDLSSLAQHRAAVEKAPAALGCGRPSVGVEVW